MVFNTLTVGAAVTPSVVETYFSHYLKRGPLRHKPTAHISYHEGLSLIREFLDYSAKHTVEDLQSFTGQWVPAPAWVRTSDAEISSKFLDRAAQVLRAQLGQRGLEVIGGSTWWQWRRPDTPMKAEWIEMKKDAHMRNLTGEKCERAMLYIHGGAYYFGSTSEHRYQMQRHARKLRAKVLSPKYRLAPQFPFPCGLFDCLAAYFYLLEHFDPSQIVIAGDSAGGGMVLSVLVTLRDQGQPLPAGSILLSPWVDLTHSFPSVAGDGVGDYIPPHGFHHKPSMAWPPPPDKVVPKERSRASIPPVAAVELPAVAADNDTSEASEKDVQPKAPKVGDGNLSALPARPPPRFGQPLTIDLDGRRVELRNQIQMYTTNQLLAHPLVSPVMQPSLGGLPPMLIQVGGAELLRDEQIYLAHKAANPALYPPSETIMREFDPQRKGLETWPPTDVQLQVWEDLCHVPHTLSFTRPAKYMYRSVAQFAAWALAHAQKHGISIQNDDTISVISSDEDEEDDGPSSVGNVTSETLKSRPGGNVKPLPSVGKAGDPLPPFKDHMIRQRVTRHGVVYPLAPVSEIAALALDPANIGVPKPGPVRKWLTTHSASEQKFANERKKTDRKRSKELALGYDSIPGERPPPTALVNRIRKGIAPEEKKRGRSWGLAMWSGWGSNHDEQTLQREEKERKEATRKASAASALDLNTHQRLLSVNENAEKQRSRSSSAVNARTQQQYGTSEENERDRGPSVVPSAGASYDQEIVDTGQADQSAVDEKRCPTDAAPTSRPISHSLSSPIPIEHEIAGDHQPAGSGNADQMAIVPTTSVTSPGSELIPGTDHTYLGSSSDRPHNGVQAYPFELKDVTEKSASTLTLDSQAPEAQVSAEPDAPPIEHPDDVVDPVELPSFAESENTTDGFQNGTGSVQVSQTLREESPEQFPTIPALQTSSKSLDASTLQSLESGADSGTVNKVSAEADSTTGGSALPNAPFKIRNPVFDVRTSILGSIGADGMPNAHYPFMREESSQRLTAAQNRTIDGLRPEENLKTAPFKVRSTLYEPDMTLGQSKTIDHSSIPEHTSLFDASARKESPLGKEIGAPSQNSDLSAADERRNGSPQKYIPVAQGMQAPSALPSRATPSADDAGDLPPPPPPKDDSYIPSPRKTTGLRKPNNSGSSGSIQMSTSSGSPGKIGSTPPTLGNLDFETRNNDRSNSESLMPASGIGAT